MWTVKPFFISLYKPLFIGFEVVPQKWLTLPTKLWQLFMILGLVLGVPLGTKPES